MINARIIGNFAFCIPRNQPVKANKPKVAGAAYILMKKYSLAKSSTSGLPSIKLKLKKAIGICNNIIKKLPENAVKSDRDKTKMTSLLSFFPTA